MNSRPNKTRISESSLIKKYFAPFANEGAFELRDDAAEIKPEPDKSYVITQDAIAEGVHFFSDDAANLIAKKALRVNLSDIAAKGASPKYISLALGLGSNWDENWVAEFANGLHQDCDHYNVELTGGDTFCTGGGFVISITKIGEISKQNYVSRLGAEPGDVIYVTGTIGDSALGLLARQYKLNALEEQNKEYLINRYLLPQPRVELADVICHYATASMDVSDGFVGDLQKLCEASGVSAEVDSSKIPLSKPAKSVIQSESNSLKTALTGGDDYEILFTVKPDQCALLEKSCKAMPFLVTRVGEISSGQGVKVFDTSGKVIEFAQSSYDHSGEMS